MQDRPVCAERLVETYCGIFTAKELYQQKETYMNGTDPKQTHMDKHISFVDDYSTDGRPDTIKIYKDVIEQLRKAQAAHKQNCSLESFATLKFWQGKLAQYSARARARKS